MVPLIERTAAARLDSCGEYAAVGLAPHGRRRAGDYLRGARLTVCGMRAGKGRLLFHAHSGVSNVANLACFSQEGWPGPGLLADQRPQRRGVRSGGRNEACVSGQRPWGVLLFNV